MQNKKLVMFDFDGTLIESVPDLANALNYMLRQMGLREYPEVVIRQWVGNGASTLVKRALSGVRDVENVDIGYNILEPALDTFLEYYEEHLVEKTYLYDGVLESLEILKLNNIKMAIITNKPYEFITPILKRLKIEHYFDLCLGANSLEYKKPHPAPLLHAMQTLGFEKEESVMVGDSKNDIIAANEAGVESIAVSYGYNYGEDITLYAPSIIIDRFSEIIGVLGLES